MNIKFNKQMILLSILLILVSGGTAVAEINNSGEDPANPLEFSSGNFSRDDCSILYFAEATASSSDFDRFIGLGLEMTHCTNPAEMTLEYMLGFHVVIIYLAGTDELAGQATAIEQFVSVGGSLYIHQPNAAGEVMYAPAGFEIFIENPGWCNYPSSDYGPCIIDAGHSLMSGFTNDDLGGDFDLVGELGAGYTVHAINCVCEDPAVASGEFGSGLVVFDTSNFGGSHAPSAEYVLNMIDFLCLGQGTTATESETWGGLKSLYR
jgi:hypothetical protein